MYKLIGAIVFLLAVGLIFWALKKFSKRYLDPFFIIIMLLGIVCMIQPFYLPIYTYGFTVLLTGFIGYFISSHLSR